MNVVIFFDFQKVSQLKIINIIYFIDSIIFFFYYFSVFCLKIH